MHKGKPLKENDREPDEKAAADKEVTQIAKEIGGVIKELSTHGISGKEARHAVKNKNIVLPTEIKLPEPAIKEPEKIPCEIGVIKPLYMQKEMQVPQEPLVPNENVVKIGCLYPETEKEKAQLFLDGLTDVLQAVKHHPFSLEKIYEAVLATTKKINLRNLLEIYEEQKLEVLLVVIPNYQIFPEAKNISEALKKLPKKRKVLIEAIPLSKISSRSTFVGLVVDIALFKGRGIGDFQN